jgi:hypothetical protein
LGDFLGGIQVLNARGDECEDRALVLADERLECLAITRQGLGYEGFIGQVH